MGCKEINLNIDDSGKTITTAEGTIFKVTLVSNRSTGNSWHNISYDKAVLSQVGEPVYEKNKDKLIGAPGQVIYTFKTLKKGETNLQMDYGALHSPGKKPVKKFQIKIEVK